MKFRTLFVLGLLAMTVCTLHAAQRPAAYPDSPQQQAGKFRNVIPTPSLGFLKTVRLAWNALFNKPSDTVPAAPITVATLTRAQLLAAPDRSLFRLGHSTVLLKLRGEFWLTDPVFSERASPVQWAGPKRFHAPPISLADLPSLKGVLLSHNHYDHLDHASILALADKADYFLAPLGVGDTLIEWGVPESKVRQFDWWQSTTVDGVRFVATPAQHFSGRGLFDANKSLWASWVILDDELRVFFSGDTGYFDGFKAIGERYGPFDVTLMETGAYDKQWPHVHMQPEQTLQAHLDLKGQWLMPVHNGTFDLAMHAWHEPFDRISALAAERGVALATPQMGQRLDLQQPQAGEAWWLATE